MAGAFERRPSGMPIDHDHTRGHERRDVVAELVRYDGWGAVFRRLVEGDPVLLAGLRGDRRRLLQLRDLVERAIFELSHRPVLTLRERALGAANEALPWAVAVYSGRSPGRWPPLA